MASIDHNTSTIYDIIFAGGTVSPIRIAIVLTVRSGGAAACVTAGRLAEADPSLKILVSTEECLVSRCLSHSTKPLRSWKLVHIPVKYRIIYSQGAVFPASFVPQKHSRSMWQNLVQRCMIAHWLLLVDRPWVVDLVWTVWRLSLWSTFASNSRN